MKKKLISIILSLSLCLVLAVSMTGCTDQVKLRTTWDNYVKSLNGEEGMVTTDYFVSNPDGFVTHDDILSHLAFYQSLIGSGMYAYATVEYDDKGKEISIDAIDINDYDSFALVENSWSYSSVIYNFIIEEKNDQSASLRFNFFFMVNADFKVTENGKTKTVGVKMPAYLNEMTPKKFEIEKIIVDPDKGTTVDYNVATLHFAKQNGNWVITSLEHRDAEIVG